MLIVIPVPGWLLLITLGIGAALAIVGGLIYRFARKEGGKNLMWTGVGMAALCGIGFLLGVITGG